jgi:hypothetical protein
MITLWGYSCIWYHGDMNYGKITLVLTVPAALFSYGAFDLARKGETSDAIIIGGMATIIIFFQWVSAKKWNKHR